MCVIQEFRYYTMSPTCLSITGGASKERIKAAAHDHELVYCQERDRASEEIGNKGEGLDKLGEIVQDKGEKLEEDSANLQSLGDVVDRDKVKALKLIGQNLQGLEGVTDGREGLEERDKELEGLEDNKDDWWASKRNSRGNS